MFGLLYTGIPEPLADGAERLPRIFEKIPLVSEIAGSLFIMAVK